MLHRSYFFQTQNDVLRDYLFMRDDVLSFLLKTEALPPNTLCDICDEEQGKAEATYRCLSCMGHPRFCHSCCHKVHQRDPFHKIQHYEDGYFRTVPMRSIGFRINLGHNGNECPADVGPGFLPVDFKWFQDDDMVFVDVTGIQRHHVRWCNCYNHLPKTQQLIQSGYFPSTWRSPQTAFTFQVLDGFYLDVMECHVAAMSVFEKLRRLTDSVDPESVPVSVTSSFLNYISNNGLQNRYRELMTASREWNDLHNRKRAGFGHDTDQKPGDGDLAIFCSICPQPGINIPDDWKEDPQRYLMP